MLRVLAINNHNGIATWLLWGSAILCAGPALAVQPPQPALAGHEFSAAEVLFHREPRWLGADAALSIPLDSRRILWLFGDTFIATTDAHVRKESRMVRNTVAIQTGTDPRSASMKFHWRQEGNRTPAAFFADREPGWFWPGHGVRLDEGPLVVFLYLMAATPNQGLGFRNDGAAIALIDNPDESPEQWKPRFYKLPRSRFDAVPATAVMRVNEHVVGLAIRQAGIHAGALVRYRVDQLIKGQVDQAEWWTADQRRWVATEAVDRNGPSYVLDDAGAECSVHWDPRRKSFLHIASYGFGASTIGLRTAPAITGPWSAPVTVYKPPESAGPHPFVYAAKAHPELVGPDSRDLIVTYATNSFQFADLFTAPGAAALYWPRFVVVRMPE